MMYVRACSYVHLDLALDLVPNIYAILVPSALLISAVPLYSCSDSFSECLALVHGPPHVAEEV